MTNTTRGHGERITAAKVAKEYAQKKPVPKMLQVRGDERARQTGNEREVGEPVAEDAPCRPHSKKTIFMSLFTLFCSLSLFLLCMLLEASVSVQNKAKSLLYTLDAAAHCAGWHGGSRAIAELCFQSPTTCTVHGAVVPTARISTYAWCCASLRSTTIRQIVRLQNQDPNHGKI